MVRTVQPATVVDVVRAFQVELKDTKVSQKVNGTPANVESVVVLSVVWVNRLFVLPISLSRYQCKWCMHSITECAERKKQKTIAATSASETRANGNIARSLRTKNKMSQSI